MHELRGAGKGLSGHWTRFCQKFRMIDTGYYEVAVDGDPVFPRGDHGVNTAGIRITRSNLRALYDLRLPG